MEVNNTQIARNFKFWRRKGDSSPRFMDDKVKNLVFHPLIYGSLGKLVLVRPRFG